MPRRIIDSLCGLGPVSAREVAPDAVRAYAGERLAERTHTPAYELDSLLDDVLVRFESSASPGGALWKALDATGVEGWAYLLEAVVDAYVVQERREPAARGARPAAPSGPGRPLTGRGVLARAHPWLLEIPEPGERMELLARLCRDFLDEEVEPATLLDQAKKAAHRDRRPPPSTRLPRS